MGIVANCIIPPARLTRWYAETLLSGIAPDQFGRLAQGVVSNHPAWSFGHLAIYPDRCIEILGRKDLARPDERYKALFGFKTQCVDDPAGTIYPPMDEIVSRFFTRFDAALAVIAETPDEAFAAPLPKDSLSDVLPTVGARVNFLMSAHAMTHLGQVSAWRRFMGLPPAME